MIYVEKFCCSWSCNRRLQTFSPTHSASKSCWRSGRNTRILVKNWYTGNPNTSSDTVMKIPNRSTCSPFVMWSGRYAGVVRYLRWLNLGKKSSATMYLLPYDEVLCREDFCRALNTTRTQCCWCRKHFERNRDLRFNNGWH